MCNREIELASPLVRQVVEWAQSSELVCGMASDKAHSYDYDEGAIPLRISTAAEWNHAIDIYNEDSPYLTLIEVTTDIQRAYGVLHRYGHSRFTDLIGNEVERVCRAVTDNNRTEELALQLRELDVRPKGTIDETVDQMWSTIQTHLAAVIYARAASLSTRDVQTESIFHAYRLGLLPFGWDWESLWCLNPREYM